MVQNDEWLTIHKMAEEIEIAIKSSYGISHVKTELASNVLETILSH
jgi:hypothetical protein